jgi:Tfp pilus assembly protein PilN
MISLLPKEEKRQLRAARTNSLLVKYNIFLIIGIGFLSIAVGVTYLYLTNSKAVAEETVEQNTAKVSSFAAIESDAQQFRTNLSTAKQIIDKEVTYTKVILGISKLLPSGVILDSLSLDAQTFGTQTTLVAHAKSYSAALALKDEFQKSSLFSDVHFQSISGGDSTTQTAYPFAVNLNVTIKKDAAK